MSVEEKLKELGLEIPPPRAAMGNYVTAVRTGNLVYTAGQVCAVGSEITCRGKLGREVTVEEGYAAARLAALNCLSAIKGVLGDLERVERVVKVLGFVNSAEGFHQQPRVMNGASDLLVSLFGEKGRHARAAIGVYQLPGDAAVEVEMVVEVK